jgi:SAM-dependent methyltransferase
VNPRRCLDELGIPGDLSGLRVLEIGAWDGAFTFELARRGAAVTALDIQDPDVTVFNAVRDILNVDVTYVRASVYDMQPQAQEPFDIVVFAGVYYHLKSPALALQRIREVLKDDGVLYIEGASCSRYLGEQLARALPGTSAEALARIVDRLPLSFFDGRGKIYAHWSNWWFPTTCCLEAMLLECGYREVEVALNTNAFYDYSHPRLMGHAHADPARRHPGEQRLEHEVYERDYTSSRLNAADPVGKGTRLKRLLRRTLREMRRRLAGHP